MFFSCHKRNAPWLTGLDGWVFVWTTWDLAPDDEEDGSINEGCRKEPSDLFGSLFTFVMMVFIRWRKLLSSFFDKGVSRRTWQWFSVQTQFSNTIKIVTLLFPSSSPCVEQFSVVQPVVLVVVPAQELFVRPSPRESPRQRRLANVESAEPYPSMSALFSLHFEQRAFLSDCCDALVLSWLRMRWSMASPGRRRLTLITDLSTCKHDCSAKLVQQQSS